MHLFRTDFFILLLKLLTGLRQLGHHKYRNEHIS